MLQIEKVENGYVVSLVDFELVDEDGLPDQKQHVFADIDQMMVFIHKELAGGMKVA